MELQSPLRHITHTQIVLTNKEVSFSEVLCDTLEGKNTNDLILKGWAQKDILLFSIFG